MVKQGLNAFQASYFTNRYFFVRSMEIIKFIDANCYQNDISRHDDIIILNFQRYCRLRILSSEKNGNN